MPFRTISRFIAAASYFVLIGFISSHAPALADTNAVEPDSKPNIIFILTDDQTFESLDKMPFLSKDPRWIRFTNAFIENPLCCPSRATILTGQSDTHTGVLSLRGPTGGEALDESQTLATWLSDAGYHTALVGKYLNAYPWRRGPYVPAGWSDWFAMSSQTENGYRKYYMNDNGKVTSYRKTYSTDVFFERAKTLVNTLEQPFFIYLALYAPHRPSIAAKGDSGHHDDVAVVHDASFNEEDMSDKPRHMRGLPLLDVKEQERMRRRQWDTLLAVDRGIESLMAELEKKDILDNTVIFFMTDNAYAFGEHRWVGKRCPHDVCMKTPLLVFYPGGEARSIDALVSNADIAPTIVALAGATPKVGHDGVSLLPLINKQETAWRDGVLGHWDGSSATTQYSPPPYWTVRTRDHRYTEYVTGEKELYIYPDDPSELDNKAGTPAVAGLESQLAKQLAELKARAIAPIAAPPGGVAVQSVPLGGINEDSATEDSGEDG